jgi:arabinofuranosyltransferase
MINIFSYNKSKLFELLPLRFFKNIWWIPALGITFILSYSWKDYQLDDAYIYLRYIKNYVNGFGLVYNPGEKYNALTSPFYTYLLALISLFIKDLNFLVSVQSFIFIFFSSILFSKIFFKDNILGKVFMSCSLSSFSLLYYCLGMETGVYIFLIALSILFFQNKNQYMFICLALLVGVRTEGILLGVVLVVSWLLHTKKLPSLSILVLSFSLFLFPFIFNYFYYGQMVPHSATAKLYHAKSGNWPSFLEVKYLFNSFFKNNFLALFFLSGTSFLGFVSTFKSNSLNLKILFYLIFLFLFYNTNNIPNYHWYYAPFFYFFLIFSSVGVVFLIENSKDFFPGKASLFISLLNLLGTFYSLKSYTIYKKDKGIHEAYFNYGNWFKENTDPKSSIASCEIGIIGYFSNRRIIDILGLTNPYNAELIGKNDYLSWLTFYQPDYILVHNPVWKFEKGVNLLNEYGLYEKITPLDYKDLDLYKKCCSHNVDSVNQQIVSVVTENTLKN